MNHPVLGPITQRLEYDAHPVGKPPITYNNTYRPAVRTNIQVLGGKTGYNDDARYCLVIATKIDGHTYYMSFLSNEGKLTRFGDVARVADWVVSRRPKNPPPGIPVPAKSTTTLASTHAPAHAHTATPTRAAAEPAAAESPAPSDSAPAAESPPAPAPTTAPAPAAPAPARRAGRAAPPPAPTDQEPPPTDRRGGAHTAGARSRDADQRTSGVPAIRHDLVDDRHRSLSNETAIRSAASFTCTGSSEHALVGAAVVIARTC